MKRNCTPRSNDSGGDGGGTLVDIGAAEGYYAVGWAFRLPRARVIAFEMEKPYHSAIRRFASANGVADRLEIRGMATPDGLQSIVSTVSRPVVLSDCEGAEMELLDPLAIPALQNVTIVCEVHELIRPGVGQPLAARFKPTHSLEVVSSTPRGPSDLPATVTLPSTEVSFALDEGRKGIMHWYVLRPLRKSLETDS